MIESFSIECAVFTAIMLGLAIFSSAFLYCATIAHQQRKQTFRARPTTTFHEWCETHYPDLSERELHHVEAVVRIFNDEIGVHVTQLEPSDELLKDYCLKGICSHFDDTWEAWTEKLAKYIRTVRGIEMSRNESLQSSLCVTLDDVVRETIALLSTSNGTADQR